MIPLEFLDQCSRYCFTVKNHKPAMGQVLFCEAKYSSLDSFELHVENLSYLHDQEQYSNSLYLRTNNIILKFTSS
jgi:GTP cyclohydrolase II